MKRRFHRAFYALMRILVAPYFATLGRYRWRVYRPKSSRYIVLTNHNTNYDFFLTGLSFRAHMYYVASEAILRHGLGGRLVKLLSDPIPRKKGASGKDAADEILRRLKNGSNVCMAVEGNRSFTGETGWISPANAPLIRASGAGLITYRIHGGYFASPRWSAQQRRGRIWGELVREYTPSELAAMTDAELTEAIRRDIYVNAYDDQAKHRYKYKGKAPAEHLETALFLCPECKRFSTLHSAGATLRCEACGLSATYDDFGYLHAAPFETVLAWSDWQRAYLQDFLPTTREDCDRPIFSDSQVRLYAVGHHAAPLVEGSITLYPDRLCFSDGARECAFPLRDITHFSIYLTCNILFTAAGSYYEVKPQRPYSALKYLICWRFLTGRDYR